MNKASMAMCGLVLGLLLGLVLGFLGGVWLASELIPPQLYTLEELNARPSNRTPVYQDNN